MDDFLKLQTDSNLLDKLHQLRKPSAAEILEQRVSFAYSSIKTSTGVTREQVRQVILEHNGGAPAGG